MEILSTYKTFVVADLHGNYRLLDNFLKFSGYDKSKHRLVCAGDFCDIGEHTMQVLATLEHERAIILVGNHEFAHCFKYPITPYDYKLDEYAVDYWMQNIVTKKWGIACAVGDVLITHAGVSLDLWNYKNFFEYEVWWIAEYLNQTFWSGTIHHGKYLELLGDRWLNYDEVLSPLWFRPYDSNFINGDVVVSLPAPLKQIAGHTPLSYYPEKTQNEIADAGLTMIDPYSRAKFHNQDYCLWAEIEDGVVTRKEHDG